MKTLRRVPFVSILVVASRRTLREQQSQGATGSDSVDAAAQRRATAYLKNPFRKVLGLAVARKGTWPVARNMLFLPVD